MCIGFDVAVELVYPYSSGSSTMAGGIPSGQLEGPKRDLSFADDVLKLNTGWARRELCGTSTNVSPQDKAPIHDGSRSVSLFV